MNCSANIHWKGGGKMKEVNVLFGGREVDRVEDERGNVEEARIGGRMDEEC